MRNKKIKILHLDIETSLMEVFVWSLGEQYVGLGQLIQDWNILAFAAKWDGDPADKMIYMDLSKSKSVRNDKRLVKALWKLLNTADIIITKNGVRFDEKKINARFHAHKLSKPSSYRHIDIERITRKHFAFTSQSLEYCTDKFCKKYKKLKHKKFPGITLWIECKNKNPEAWKEMQLYNKHDVLSAEELYHGLKSWDTTVNFEVYEDGIIDSCVKCNEGSLKKNGLHYSNSGKYQRYKCKNCNYETRSKQNLLSLEKRKSLRPSTR